MSTYASAFVAGVWDGAPAVVVGGGPSLRAFQWELLDAAARRGCIKLVAVNNAVRRLPHAHIGVTIDAVCACTLLDDGSLDAFSGVFVYAGVDKARVEAHPRVVRAVPESAHAPGAWPRALECVAHGGNSGLAGLCVADQLGAGPVYMLGYDLGVAVDGAACWHGVYDAGCMLGRFERFAAHFEAVRDKLRCTPLVVGPSALSERWARSRLPREIVEPAVWVSFYTERYAPDANELTHTLRAHGLEHCVEFRECRGSWAANQAQKPAHMLAMRQRFAGRSLVWVDADARVRRYPTLLGLMPALDIDFAAHWFTRRGCNAAELLSGTLYVAATPRANELLLKWHELGFTFRNEWDQKLLARAVPSVAALRVHELPSAYTYIHDLSRAHYPGVEPIVEHMQRSREARHW
jgi:hypothetical protein